MGNVRLVKTSAQVAPESIQPVSKQVRFTNWSRQFLAEHLIEQASRPSAQAQFKALFKEEVVN